MLFSANAFAADLNLSVRASLKQSPLGLSNIVLTEIARKFGSTPMGASITFEIDADYDSGFGSIENAILQEKNVSGSSFDTQESNTIQFLGVQDFSKTPAIRLGDAPAVSGSSGTLMIPITISVLGWTEQMSSHRWVYRILSGRQHTMVKTLAVTLDKAQGWSVEIQ